MLGVGEVAIRGRKVAEVRAASDWPLQGMGPSYFRRCQTLLGCLLPRCDLQCLLQRLMIVSVAASCPLQVLVRLSFGIDASSDVAMKLVVRAESEEISDAVHQIIQGA